MLCVFHNCLRHITTFTQRQSPILPHHWGPSNLLRTMPTPAASRSTVSCWLAPSAAPNPPWSLPASCRIEMDCREVVRPGPDCAGWPAATGLIQDGVVYAVPDPTFIAHRKNHFETFSQRAQGKSFQLTAKGSPPSPQSLDLSGLPETSPPPPPH